MNTLEWVLAGLSAFLLLHNLALRGAVAYERQRADLIDAAMRRLNAERKNGPRNRRRFL